jgi:hypothetical protein
MTNRKPRLFAQGQWVKKREDPFVMEQSAVQKLRIDDSRRNESFYGVVISSTEYNKITTKIRILFYPKGKIEEVMKSRLDFAPPPADINQAEQKFLESFATI